MESVDIRATAAPWNRGIELLISQKTPGGKIAVAKNIVMETLEEDVLEPKPSLTIKISEAQTLMDDLWQAGIRPTEGSGSAGALRATEKHLEDMRKITFSQLGLIGDKH